MALEPVRWERGGAGRGLRCSSRYRLVCLRLSVAVPVTQQLIIHTHAYPQSWLLQTLILYCTTPSASVIIEH